MSTHGLGSRGFWASLALGVGLLGLIGCIKSVPAPTAGGNAATTETAAHDAPAAETTAEAVITIDGSSTVFPISQAMAEAYQTKHEGVRISVGSSGTGGGIKKFIQGEIEICDASRAIKESEVAECQAKGIEFIELQIAIDGLSVVVHPENDWAQCLTIADLNKMWAKDSTVAKWNEVRPEWPDQPIALFGADTDSGTFDYFTEVINGKAKESRADYTASSNDNVLVNGVADNKYALGYFGYGYYVANQDRLKAVPIENDKTKECVAPTPETIEGGTYSPLSRPLFIYVTKTALKRPEVADFVKFYLTEEGQGMVATRDFIKLPPAVLTTMQARLDEALK